MRSLDVEFSNSALIRKFIDQFFVYTLKVSSKYIFAFIAERQG
jgi:hypothetical protein